MKRVRDRLAGVGLRWRLAAWVAAVTMACTAIAFVAVYRGTGTQLREQIDNEITGDAGGLARELTQADHHTPADVLEAANRYIRDQPFGASSTLLFAVVPGAGVSTNRPELFTSLPPDEGESIAAQEQENRLGKQVLTAHYGYSTVDAPDAGDLRLLKRAVSAPGRVRAIVGAGETLAAVGHAQGGVARAFILAGALALIGALLAALLIGTRVSRPLRRIAAVAARVDAGELHPRIEDAGGEGREVRVLADAFNHMLDRLTDAFAGQRAFVADASHELRTPMTVMRGQLEVLAAEPDPSSEEVQRVAGLVQAEIARMSRLVDDLLLLAKTEQTQFLRQESIDLPPFLQELWDGISLLARRRFELGPIPPGRLRADPDRLAQAIRNLLSNAIEHTAPERGLVRMRVEVGQHGRVRFLVEDDGPGVPVEQRERVFDRFYRIDHARDRASGGTGLGLAIVRAIATAHGGRVAVDGSPEGGARIELELPRFVPARRRGGALARSVGASNGAGGQEKPVEAV